MTMAAWRHPGARAAAGLCVTAALAVTATAVDFSSTSLAAGRALALLRGREYVLPDDITSLAPDVFRHRLALTFEALAEGVEVDDVVQQVIEATTPPLVTPGQESIPEPPRR